MEDINWRWLNVCIAKLVLYTNHIQHLIDNITSQCKEKKFGHFLQCNEKLVSCTILLFFFAIFFLKLQNMVSAYRHDVLKNKSCTSEKFWKEKKGIFHNFTTHCHVYSKTHNDDFIFLQMNHWKQQFDHCSKKLDWLN